MGEEKKTNEKMINSIEMVDDNHLELGELHVVRQLLDNSQFKGSDAKFIFDLSNKVDRLMEKEQAKDGNGAMTLPDGFVPDGMMRQE